MDPSNNYKIIPYNDFSEFGTRAGYKDSHIESEEIVLCHEGIKNIKDYILRVDFITSEITGNVASNGKLDLIKLELDKLNIIYKFI